MPDQGDPDDADGSDDGPDPGTADEDSADRAGGDGDDTNAGGTNGDGSSGGGSNAEEERGAGGSSDAGGGSGGSDDGGSGDSAGEDSSDSAGGGRDDSAGGGGGDSAGSGGAARSQLAPDEQYCASCGEPIKKKAEICPHCGVRNRSASSVGGSTKDRTTAGILAILLGGVGAHRFYLEDVGLGLLYLCFFWTGIPFLVGLIEGIIYLTKTDEEFQRRYVD